MKLYHYVHCPFCVRVRMGMGLIGVKYESVVTSYDDEQTPLSLTGKKMLPIMEYADGRTQNESLDILKSLDENNVLGWKKLSENDVSLNILLDKISSPVHSLAMPYWIWTPEFNEKSRAYFQTKKEVKRGPFKDLVKNQQSFINQLNPILQNELFPDLNPFYKSEKLTIMDIMIASHLWGMYIVPEFQFESSIHEYLKRVKTTTHFNYHEDYWK